MQMLAYGESLRLKNNGVHANNGRSMGTYNWDAVVELEYPEAFREALSKVLDVKKTFTYVYLGGAFTEPDQDKTLWFLSKARHVRVRHCPFPYNAFRSLLCGMLTQLRGLPRQNSWSLERNISM
jgi:hypothetical protein